MNATPIQPNTKETQPSREPGQTLQELTKLQFEATVPEDQFDELAKTIKEKVTKMGLIFG